MRLFRSTVSAASVLAAVLAASALPAAASSAYLKIGTIAGESLAAGHVGWIEVDSVGWRPAPPSAPPGPAPAGVANGGPGSVGLSKKTDKATPVLVRAAAGGTHYPSATLEVQGGTAGSYLRYELKNVMVSSFQASGGGGGQGSAEQFTLNFSAVELHYLEQKGPSGTPKPKSYNVGDARTEGGSAGGGTGASAAAVDVLRLPPAVTKVTPSAASVLAGATLSFTVEATGDCSRSRIDFGDGSPVVEYPILAGKSQPAPTHVYAKGGTFEVKAYGFADPWAKPKAAPKPSDHACGGHATTSVAVKSTAATGSMMRK
jgi:type VI secretion system secreted protein Hcp